MSKFKFNISSLFIIILIVLSPKGYLILKLLFCLTIHELGHLIVLMFTKVRYNSLNITLFGFIMEIEENLLSFKQSILFYISGIALNFFTYLISQDLEIKYISLMLFWINVIPIYPLDGHNILKAILERFIPVYYSYIIRMIISFVAFVMVLILSIYNSIDYYLYLNYIFICLMNCDLIFNFKTHYQKFILYRYLHKMNLNYKVKELDENYIKQLLRYKEMIYKFNNNYYSEKEILSYYYNSKKST